MKLTVVAFLALAIVALPDAVWSQSPNPHPGPSCKDLQLMGLQKFQELESLPAGIQVSHDPASPQASAESVGKWSYKWSYATTVSSLNGRVEIEEFGMLSKVGDNWSFGNVTGAPFTAEDFASWYGCPGGVLEAARPYSDRTNWSAAAKLEDGVHLWYYIGIDEQGKRVQGQAEVRLSGHLGQ